jgi:hypothetical protein
LNSNYLDYRAILTKVVYRTAARPKARRHYPPVPAGAAMGLVTPRNDMFRMHVRMFARDDLPYHDQSL